MTAGYSGAVTACCSEPGLPGAGSGRFLSETLPCRGAERDRHTRDRYTTDLCRYNSANSLSRLRRA